MSTHHTVSDIREHYDLMSPYYQSLWGEHIHHGYWIRGDESKEVAQLQLVDHLAQTAGIEAGDKVLDVGCGLGAASIHLSTHYCADVTGITISPVQLDMATRAAATQKAAVKFLLMDAESMHFDESFDLVWAIESISHFQDVRAFFTSAARFLRPGGTVAVIDWFRRESLNAALEKQFIAPIEESMLVRLRTLEEYTEWLRENGLVVTRQEILNRYCARTWDVCLDFLKEKKFWQLAARHSAHFLAHLHGFRAMRAGFATGNFVYGLLIASRL